MTRPGVNSKRGRLKTNLDALFGNNDYIKLFSSVLGKVAKFLFDAEELVVLGHSV